MNVEQIRDAADNIFLADLADVEIGEEIESLDATFLVQYIKPINRARHQYSVEVICEGYQFAFFPVIIENAPEPMHYDIETPKVRERKNKNKEKYEEIYEKSKTVSSSELAVQYEMSYAMVRYIIRKMNTHAKA